LRTVTLGGELEYRYASTEITFSKTRQTGM